jgi:hypothetical protein
MIWRKGYRSDRNAHCIPWDRVAAATLPAGEAGGSKRKEGPDAAGRGSARGAPSAGMRVDAANRVGMPCAREGRSPLGSFVAGRGLNGASLLPCAPIGPAVDQRLDPNTRPVWKQAASL